MCKEDIRIKRKTAYNTVVVTATGPGTPAMPARPDRIALMVQIGPVVNFGIVQSTSLRMGAGDPAKCPLILGLTHIDTFKIATIEEYGSVIRGEVTACDYGATGPQLTITEVFFTDELDNV